MDIEYTRASTDDELHQILDLQKRNSAIAITTTEKEKEGFVTVSHNFETLKKMNDACPHIIAKDGNLVVGYALVMLEQFRDEISILSAMFETANELIGDKNYLAMGQICIAKAYRKQGVFKGMYYFYKNALQDDYDSLLTEVATNNHRSVNAHLSVGFKMIKTQTSNGISWELMYWDWS